MPIYAQKLDLGVILKPSWNLAGTKIPTKTHQVVQKGSTVSRRGVPFDDLVLETAARVPQDRFLYHFALMRRAIWPQISNGTLVAPTCQPKTRFLCFYGSSFNSVRLLFLVFFLCRSVFILNLLTHWSSV